MRICGNRQVAYFTCRAMGGAFVVLAEAKFVHEKSGNRRNGKTPSNMVAANWSSHFCPIRVTIPCSYENRT